MTAEEIARARYIAQVWREQDGISMHLIDEGAELLQRMADVIDPSGRDPGTWAHLDAQSFRVDGFVVTRLGSEGCGSRRWLAYNGGALLRGRPRPDGSRPAPRRWSSRRAACDAVDREFPVPERRTTT